jgi:glycerophosphoryl diester phosphodiesterase
VLIFGHRGASGYAPENTLAAFDRALDLGADGIETDVRITRDGVLVGLHDASVNRTTDGNGRIAQMDWSEVARLDAGSWYGTAFEGERVPRVDEILDRYVGRLELVLELKVDAAGQPLVDLLNRRELAQNRTLRVIGFSWSTIQAVARALPQLKIGFVTFHLNAELIRKVAGSAVSELWPEVGALESVLVQQAHEAGLTVATWGVRSRQQVARSVQAGVDAITLDCPDWAIGYRDAVAYGGTPDPTSSS